MEGPTVPFNSEVTHALFPGNSLSELIEYDSEMDPSLEESKPEEMSEITEDEELNQYNKALQIIEQSPEPFQDEK